MPATTRPASEAIDADDGDNLGTGNGRKQGTKRQKYVARACHPCKRRKVKCSGDDACQQCQSRNLQCRYSPDPPELPTQGRSPRPGSATWEKAPTATERQAGLPRFVTSSQRSDPRVDGLSDRMRILERTVARLLESADLVKDPSSSNTNQTPGDLADEVCDEDDANQFSAREEACGDLTLSSQVAAMSALLSKPPSPKPGRSMSVSKIGISLELPSAAGLQHLLDVYFRDFDCYFPFLAIEETQSRIHNVIRRLGYNSHNRVQVDSLDDLSTVVLLCHMLALAECVDPDEGACDGHTKPGWEQYSQGCRAIQRFSHSKTLNLDVVRAQCLAAAYLMHNELLHAASRAVSITWQLATIIRLHDKKTWPTNAEEIEPRRRLWWTIYFLDRQISRRSGIAYHIRDTEFDVEDFCTIGDCAEPSPDYQSGTGKTDSNRYMQALVNLARLWGHVWDTFFAVGATKKGDWMEVEIMDARILNTRRQLPSALTWSSDDLVTYTMSGEDEPHVRRRLQIYTRLTLLRMLIRQNPVRQVAFDPDTAHICSKLAREIIHSHDTFVSQYPEARATGYFTTSSIVECVYHLAPVMHNSKDVLEHAACVSAFKQAHGILVKLSLYNNVAKKALRALDGLIKKWGNGNSSGIDSVGHQSGLTDFNPTQTPYYDPGLFNGLTTDGLGIDFAQWMDVGMGPLFDSELSVRLDG